MSSKADVPATAADVEKPASVPDLRPVASYGSDLVVDVLHELGVRYLPLNPGSSFRGLHDSLVNHGGNRDPQLLLCLHEEIAVSLAHGYAKATGGIGVAAVHDLVGLMHASMAVYDAFCDRTPLLVLGGSGPLDPAQRRPIDWLHSATTQAQLVRDYVVWDAEPATPAALVSDVLRAHQRALSAPRGPAYVSLDAGAQEAQLAEVPPLPRLRMHAPAPLMAANEEAVRRAADLLAAARRPVIVGGRVGLVPESTPLLVELVELTGAGYYDDRNVVAFPTAHPHNLSGHPGLLTEADVVLAVDVVDLPALLRPRGRSRDEGAGEGAARDGQPTSDAATPAVIDLSHGDLGLRSWTNAFAAPVERDVQLLADPVTGLRQLLDELRKRELDVAARRAEVTHLGHELHARQAAAVESQRDQRPVAPSRLVTELWKAVREHDVLLCLRNTRTWPHGVWQFDGAGEYLGHSGGGGVGYGPGAFVGGALAARDQGKLGVGIIGDGDLLMAAGALWTAVHYEIPLLMVVNDNSSFYNDEPHQAEVARQRGRPVENSWIGMRISAPTIDIAALARSYGAWATGPVADPDGVGAEIEAALQQAVAGRVAVVHVLTARE